MQTYCCYDGCGNIRESSCEKEGVWCTRSQSNCEDACGGEWCTAAAAPSHPSVAPSGSHPSVAPSGSHSLPPPDDAMHTYCCYDGCGNIRESSCEKEGAWCTRSQSNCEDACGGEWCTAAAAPSHPSVAPSGSHPSVAPTSSPLSEEFVPYLQFDKCDYAGIPSQDLGAVASTSDCFSIARKHAGEESNPDWFVSSAVIGDGTRHCYYHDKKSVGSLDDYTPDNTADTAVLASGDHFVGEIMDGLCGVKRNDAEYLGGLCDQAFDYAKKTMSVSDSRKYSTSGVFSACSAPIENNTWIPQISTRQCGFFRDMGTAMIRYSGDMGTSYVFDSADACFAKASEYVEKNPSSPDEPWAVHYAQNRMCYVLSDAIPKSFAPEADNDELGYATSGAFASGSAAKKLFDSPCVEGAPVETWKACTQLRESAMYAMPAAEVEKVLTTGDFAKCADYINTNIPTMDIALEVDQCLVKPFAREAIPLAASSKEDCFRKAKDEYGAIKGAYWYAQWEDNGGGTKTCSAVTFAHGGGRLADREQSMSPRSAVLVSGNNNILDVLSGPCVSPDKDMLKNLCNGLWDQIDNDSGDLYGTLDYVSQYAPVCLPPLETKINMLSAHDTCHGRDKTCAGGTKGQYAPWFPRCVQNVNKEYMCAYVDVAMHCDTDADCNPEGTPLGLGFFECGDGGQMCKLKRNADSTINYPRTRCEHPPLQPVAHGVSTTVASAVPGEFSTDDGWECKCPPRDDLPKLGRYQYAMLINNPRYTIDPENPLGEGNYKEFVPETDISHCHTKESCWGDQESGLSVSEGGNRMRPFDSYCQVVSFPSAEAEAQARSHPTDRCTVYCGEGADAPQYETIVPKCKEDFSQASVCADSTKHPPGPKQGKDLYECRYAGTYSTGIPVRCQKDGNGTDKCQKTSDDDLYPSVWHVMKNDPECQGKIDVWYNTTVGGSGRNTCNHSQLGYGTDVCNCDGQKDCTEVIGATCSMPTVQGKVTTGGHCTNGFSGVSPADIQCKFRFGDAAGKCVPFGDTSLELDKVNLDHHCSDDSDCFSQHCITNPDHTTKSCQFISYNDKAYLGDDDLDKQRRGRQCATGHAESDGKCIDFDYNGSGVENCGLHEDSPCCLNRETGEKCFKDMQCVTSSTHPHGTCKPCGGEGEDCCKEPGDTRAMCNEEDVGCIRNKCTKLPDHDECACSCECSKKASPNHCFHDPDPSKSPLITGCPENWRGVFDDDDPDGKCYDRKNCDHYVGWFGGSSDKCHKHREKCECDCVPVNTPPHQQQALDRILGDVITTNQERDRPSE